MTEAPHRWKFIRVGGVDQVVIQSGADVVNLEHLDQKLWVALACPTRGVEFDRRTLDLLDTDHDGRVRAPELIAASRWVREHFADPDLLLARGDDLPLTAIRTDTKGGRAVADEARAVQRVVGKPETAAITLADLEVRIERLGELGFNGDGVVPDTAADDDSTRALINHAIDLVGGVPDCNGRIGIDAAHAKTFFEQGTALLQWRDRGADDAGITPLGEHSRSAVEALGVVRAKIDDYFLRCRLTAYDRSAAALLHPAADDFRALFDTELAVDSAAIVALPLTQAAPDAPLPLRGALNPAWTERIDRFRTAAAEPLLGRPLEVLDEADWVRVKAQLAACCVWLAERPETALDTLAPELLRELLDPDLQTRLDTLIARDSEAAPSNERFEALERMLRYRLHLVHLLNNFVSFSEFYRREGAIFEAGTLYLDARSCQFTVEVADVAKHTVLAGLAKVYLAYCQCTRQKDGVDEEKTIVAAFTAGDTDFLFAGRNGVFYDRAGNDWDATITQVIENPLSIAQAFFAPYKKLVRMLEEQVAKRAAASDQRALGTLSSLTARTVAGAVPAKPGAAPAIPSPIPIPIPMPIAGQRGIDVGTVAALGVALGSISAVLVAVFTKFIDLGWWIPVGLLGIVLAISGPSMLIAWLKLRQRSLGPILDASGWATNGRMRINLPLGGSLTKRALLPSGAERHLRDPYSQSQVAPVLWGVGLVALAVLVAAWRLGWLAHLPFHF